MTVSHNVIDGRDLAGKILVTLAQKISLIKNRHNLIPCIAIISVGNNAASNIYVRNKLKAAEKIGMHAFEVSFSADITSNQLLIEITKLNNDPAVSGIIVQLPLPINIDKELILSSVSPEKDVDGFHPINVGYLHIGSSKGFIPCTALGCLELIKQCEPNLSSKNVVIIGRSNIVGKPLSALLLNENCTVTICHSKTINLRHITCNSDIVISAVGKPLFLTKDYFNPASIVIDVGINTQQGDTHESGNRIVGDVDFKNVHDKVRYITPVPGGVGPMTITFLLANTIKAMLNQHNLINVYE